MGSRYGRAFLFWQLRDYRKSILGSAKSCLVKSVVKFTTPSFSESFAQKHIVWASYKQCIYFYAYFFQNQELSPEPILRKDVENLPCCQLCLTSANKMPGFEAYPPPVMLGYAIPTNGRSHPLARKSDEQLVFHKKCQPCEEHRNRLISKGEPRG